MRTQLANMNAMLGNRQKLPPVARKAPDSRERVSNIGQRDIDHGRSD